MEERNVNRMREKMNKQEKRGDGGSLWEIERYGEREEWRETQRWMEKVRNAEAN